MKDQIASLFPKVNIVNNIKPLMKIIEEKQSGLATFHFPAGSKPTEEFVGISISDPKCTHKYTHNLIGFPRIWLDCIGLLLDSWKLPEAAPGGIFR
jgi:hypothetical protein